MSSRQGRGVAGEPHHFVDELEQLASDVDAATRSGPPLAGAGRHAATRPSCRGARRRSARGSCRAHRTRGRRGSPRRPPAAPRAAAATGRGRPAPGRCSRRSRSSTCAMSARFRPVVEEGCVGVLQGEPAVDQLRAGPDWGGPLRRVGGVTTLLLSGRECGGHARRCARTRPASAHPRPAGRGKGSWPSLRSSHPATAPQVQRQPRADPILGRGDAETCAAAVTDIDVVGASVRRRPSAASTGPRQAKNLLGHARQPAGSRWRRPAATEVRTRPVPRPARPGCRRSRWPPRPSGGRSRPGRTARPAPARRRRSRAHRSGSLRLAGRAYGRRPCAAGAAHAPRQRRRAGRGSRPRRTPDGHPQRAPARRSAEGAAGALTGRTADHSPCRPHARPWPRPHRSSTTGCRRRRRRRSLRRGRRRAGTPAPAPCCRRDRSRSDRHA